MRKHAANSHYKTNTIVVSSTQWLARSRIVIQFDRRRIVKSSMTNTYTEYMSFRRCNSYYISTCMSLIYIFNIYHYGYAPVIILPVRGWGGGLTQGNLTSYNDWSLNHHPRDNYFLSKSPPLSLLGASNAQVVKIGQSLCNRDPDSIRLSNYRLSGMVFCLKPCVCPPPHPGGQNIDRCIIHPNGNHTICVIKKVLNTYKVSPSRQSAGWTRVFCWDAFSQHVSSWIWNQMVKLYTK